MPGKPPPAYGRLPSMRDADMLLVFGAVGLICVFGIAALLILFVF